jgi:hypothetical protein
VNSTVGLYVVMKRKVHDLLGIETRPQSPYPVILLTMLAGEMDAKVLAKSSIRKVESLD